MYLSYYSLDERPFTISPDPRFLFMSNRYREALAHLNYGIEDGGGFVLLTGEVGTGKTTVCRCLLQQLPEKTRLAFVLNPKLNSIELLATICDELKIKYPENCTSLKTLTDKISEYLLKCYEQGLSVVLMIDEAQNVEDDVLEQIRLLTNLETNQKKLLQIILVGQPELQEKLARRELRQLAQRITARYHLRPLSLKETIAYVMHRVKVAGSNKRLFSKKSIELLHEKALGIPRLINTICDRALISACNLSKNEVNEKIMKSAISDVLGLTAEGEYPLLNKSKQFITWGVISLLTISIIFFAFWLGQQSNGPIVASSTARSESLFKIKKNRVENDVEGAVLDNQEITSGDSLNRSVSSQNEQAMESTESISRIISNDSQQPSLISKMLGSQRWDTNGYDSLSYIMTLWNLEYSPFEDGDACEFASSYGLLCETQQGNWQSLRELNRPAILKFSAGLQGEFWGAITAIRGVNASLVFGEKSIEISLNELSTVWTGEYKILWQAPNGYHRTLKLGDQSIAVVWLGTQLKSLISDDIEVSSVFDRKLHDALVKYQRRHYLQGDGIAGMRTILNINSEVLDGIPKLLE